MYKGKIKEGQMVWVVGGHHVKTPITKMVDSVGKKYFYVNGEKFSLDTLKKVSEYITNERVYLDIEAWYEEQRKALLEHKIRNAFSGFSGTQYTIDQLNRVVGILGIEI